MLVGVDLPFLMCAPGNVDASATCILCCFTAALGITSLACVADYLLLLKNESLHLLAALPCVLLLSIMVELAGSPSNTSC